jgi:hypothetical protein
MRFFPLAVGALELGAGIVYAVNGKWWLALAWGAYAIAAVGLARAS